MTKPPLPQAAAGSRRGEAPATPCLPLTASGVGSAVVTTPSTAAAGDPLVVRTVAVGLDEVGSLLDLLPADAPVSWLRRDEGLVGWGVAAVIRTKGTARFSDADKW